MKVLAFFAPSVAATLILFSVAFFGYSFLSGQAPLISEESTAAIQLDVSPHGLIHLSRENLEP